MRDILQEFGALLSQTYDQGFGGSIDLLLLQMDEETADIFRLCAIPHQFSAEMIRVLAPALDEHSAMKFFSEFQDLSMVIAAGDDLAVHDEARAHLLKQWLQIPSDQFVQANQRLVHYFENQLLQANGGRKENLRLLKMYHLIGADESQGFHEFELIFADMWHQYRMDECENLIMLVQQYDAVLSKPHALLLTFYEGKLAAERRMWQRAEKMLSTVITNVNTTEHLRLKATHRMGIVLAKQRNWDEAVEVFQQALDLAQSSEDLAAYVDDVLLDIGCAFRDKGELNRADAILREGLKIATGQNDLKTMALIYNSLGTLNRKLGKLAEATEMFEESLRILAVNEDRFRPAQVYNNLGMTYADLRSWELSEQYFKKSLEIKKSSGDTRGQANTLTNLVRVYLNTGNENKAIESLTQANNLFKSIKDKYGQALAKRSLGKIYRNLKEIALSKAAYQEAIELFEMSGQKKDAENTSVECQALTRKKGMSRGVLVSTLILLATAIILTLASL